MRSITIIERPELGKSGSTETSPARKTGAGIAHRRSRRGFAVDPKFHAAANRGAALFMRLLFKSVGHIHVLHPEKAQRPGPFLLAGNHISHFDPFIISGIIPRKIDWMTMAEFFPYPVLGQFLRAVDAFPADRNRANRITIEATLRRLGNGAVVGIFPEGGIRNGENSVLQGASMRSGVSALADMSGAAVVPCVIVGSDRLYSPKRWLGLHRTPIWVAFGDAILSSATGSKPARREALEQEFIAALRALYAEIRQTFSLSAADLPRTPRERMAE